MPDFFIVGHSKCGTTALYEMLRRHPQICMPLKEPRFFSPELRSRFVRLGPGALPVTLDEYLALFAKAGPQQLAGEASPQYLRSLTAASRIAEAQPQARIIAVFREPASFLRSFHLQAVHNHVETVTDFRRAMGLEEARRAGRRIPRLSQAPQALLYSDHVRYTEQLRRYHDVFPREQVLVLIYDDLRNDNEGTVRRVLRFLDVDDSVPVEPVQTGRLPAVRSPALYRLSTGASMVRRRVSRSGGEGGGGSERWQRVIYKPAPAPDEEFMLELRRRFQPQVLALSEYLGRDLVTEWGYDGIG